MMQPASANNSNGSRKLGIREQIRHADSQDEIDNLLKRLNSFADASDSTRASCKTAARKRRKELQDDAR